MAGDSYITNPSAQQGESTVKKGSRNPATIEGMVQPEIGRDDSVDEGPVDIPDHLGKRPNPTLDKHGR